jgi:hypothetical protein
MKEEGVYLSRGKTTAEIKAERAARAAADARLVVVTLHEAARREAEAAAGNVAFHMNAAANVFELIQIAHEGGFLDTRHLAAVAELSALAFRHLSDTEGEALLRLQRPLREAMAGAGQDPELATTLTGLAGAAEAEGDAEQAAYLRRQAAKRGARHDRQPQADRADQGRGEAARVVRCQLSVCPRGDCRGHVFDRTRPRGVRRLHGLPRILRLQAP